MANLLVTEGLGGSDDQGLTILGVTPGVGTVDVSFSSAIVLSGDSEDLDNWTITANGASKPVFVLSVSVVGNDIELTTTEHTNAGSYTLQVPRGVVDSTSGVELIPPRSHGYVGIGVLPTIVNVRGIDERTFEVVFSEPVREDDATTPANYTVTGPTSVSVVSGVKVTDVTYSLTTTPQNRLASYTVEVENVRDLVDNSIDTST